MFLGILMIEVNEHASTFGNVLERNNCLKVFHKLLLGDHIKMGLFTYNLKFNWQKTLPFKIQISKQNNSKKKGKKAQIH